MKLPLSRSGYLLNPKTNVWSRPDYIGIAYSDGDEVEQRIAAVIEQAFDLTVLSTELRRHCTDWPSLYHLTNARANILRPFELSLHGSILEIGAGCGAITRYLGECGGIVLALEGSSRRAAIARSRTRDLENVTVVADSFERFQCEQQFDVITLIGVLEYANLFISHGNPPLSMLQRVRSLLKPNGKLIIAIENQLGLKYFAGAPEDHLGQPMYGIEGRYKTDQPQTYGRKVLTQMLKQAGFAYSEFMAPFPDYKLPVSIITESGFSYEGFDAGALAWQSVKRDPQLPQVLVFSPELAWPTMIENGLGLDYSNSFLVVARINANQKADSSILAWHFTSERWKEFCKETKFLRNADGSIETHYYPLLPGSARHATGQLLTFNIPEKSEYVQGRPLSQELIRIVTRDGWRLADVSGFLRRYLEFLVSYESAKGILVQISSPESQIPGEYFDIIPQNIIIGHDGKWHVIDKEWTLNKEENIAVGWLLFRSLLPLINSVTRFGVCADEFINTTFGLIEAIFKTIGFAVSEEKISSYARQELAVQEDVSRRGQDVDQQINWWRISLLQKLNLNQTLAERDGQINTLNQALTERDIQINTLTRALPQRDAAVVERDGQIASLNQELAQRDAAVIERDGQIASLNQELAQRDAAVVVRDVQIASLTAELGRITSTRSWKVTMPLRFAGRVLRGDWAAVQASIVSLRNVKKNSFVMEEETSANKDVVLKNDADNPKNKQNRASEQVPFGGKRILLVSYYCPSRAHAGGLRILDIYSLIKSEFPFIGLDLYTYRRPEVDWSYDGLESIFDNIYYSDTEELSVKGLLNQCKECPRYTVIDLQFHHSARHIDAFRALGGKILFTPIESLARSFFIDVKEALYNAHRLPLKDIVAGVRNTIEELKYCLKADEAICVSKADATYLRAISWSRKIKYLESGVSDIEFKHELSESSLVLNPRKKENIIIYVAFFGSQTNILAMKWYLDKVHPLIKKKVPDYMLHVVGRGDLSVFAGYQDEAVIFVGAVPSLGHYINEAKVGIVPALGGAGLRGKMSQYAFFGVPCVASPIAVKGSAYKDGVDIYITEVPEIFAAHCITLLTDEEINQRIGEMARQTVLQNYTWKSKMDIIRKVYALGDI